MSTPTQPQFGVTAQNTTSTRAVIVIEPLEQGYGHTLGNALRRVLLSSLSGAAITSVRFQQAEHEFTTIKGVSEDVLELTLNLKQVRIKSLTGQGGVARLDVKGPKTVTAADLELEAGLEIVNPEAEIATLAKDAVLTAEMVVETGVGYFPAKDRGQVGISEIALDALYSPVITVSYTVESTRVGRRTDFDRLLLDITTDGSLEPMEAVRQAAGILQAHFNQVITPIQKVEKPVEEPVSLEEAEMLRLTVEELDLPTRIANALRKGGFETVGDLRGVPKQVIAKVKNLGEKSVDIIQDALMTKGVSLGD